MIRPRAVELEQVNLVFVAFLGDFFFCPTSGLSPLPVGPTSKLGLNQKWAQTGSGWQDPDSIPSNVVFRNKKKDKRDQAAGCGAGASKFGVCCIFG